MLLRCVSTQAGCPLPTPPSFRSGGPGLLIAGCSSPSPGGTAGRGGVLDYIPRVEHLRILDARLTAKEADAAAQLASRMAQARGR